MFIVYISVNNSAEISVSYDQSLLKEFGRSIVIESKIAGGTAKRSSQCQCRK